MTSLLVTASIFSLLFGSEVEEVGPDKKGLMTYRVTGRPGPCTTLDDRFKDDGCRKAQLFCEDKGLIAEVSFALGEDRKRPGRQVVTFQCRAPARRAPAPG